VAQDLPAGKGFIRAADRDVGLDKGESPLLNAVASVDFLVRAIRLSFGIIDLLQKSKAESESSL
jgi:hypothetical protein